MPKIVKQLTASQLNALKPRLKMYDVADGKNLFITVTPSGTKSFYFRYTKPYSNARTKITIGRYPFMTLEQARRKRDELTALILEGKDPQQERADQLLREKQRLNNTFSRIADQWLKLHEERVTKRTAHKSKRLIDLYLSPYLADMQIENITPVYVVDFLKRTQRQMNKQGHKGSQIKRIISILNQVLDYALNCGFIEFNKCQNVHKAFTEVKSENMATLKAEELPELLAKVNETTIIDETVKSLMKWQLLTMVRPTEARLAQWTEIDLNAKTWTIPAERMKKRKEHVVPLSDQALAILQKIAPYSQNKPYIFASPRKRFYPLSDKSVNLSLHRLGYAGRQTAHGFRSMASTFLNESLLFSPDVIESGLAHSIGGEVRRIYNRASYLEERIKMMQYWGDYCEKCGILNGQDLNSL